MSSQPKILFEFEELRQLFSYAEGISTCTVEDAKGKECGVRLMTNALCGLSEHVRESHPTVFQVMQSLQQKVVDKSRAARVLKRRLDELESSEEPSKRQRLSPMEPTKSRKAPSSTRIEGSTRKSNRSTGKRRHRPAGLDQLREIARSQHFHNLMGQFYVLDDCDCDCVLGRSVKIHLMRRGLADMRSELAKREDEVREAEINLLR